MSEILDIAHEMARDLLDVGAMDEITMRKMEALCLPSKRSLKPHEIKRIRTKNHVSQAGFAAFLGTGKTAGAAPMSNRNETGRKKSLPHLFYQHPHHAAHLFRFPGQGLLLPFFEDIHGQS